MSDKDTYTCKSFGILGGSWSCFHCPYSHHRRTAHTGRFLCCKRTLGMQPCMGLGLSPACTRLKQLVLQSHSLWRKIQAGKPFILHILQWSGIENGRREREGEEEGKGRQKEVHFLPSVHSVTHLPASLSSIVSGGHWHPITHCNVQNMGCSSPHTAGQAVPHSVNTCPGISHSA